MKKYQNLDTFKKFLILEDKYQIKNLQNVDRESGKTRKKSGKSQGILCQNFGRHPELTAFNPDCRLGIEAKVLPYG